MNVFKCILTAMMILSFSSIATAQEKITLSTYYPAPYGEYDGLTAYSMGIGTYPYPPGEAGKGNLVVEGKIGIGTDDPQAILDVRQNDALINGLTIGRGAGNIISNTANGYRALYSNTTGVANTANGYYALYSNTTGHGNTANGCQALYANTTGHSNTANGVSALRSNTTGHYNTANGYLALYRNTTGYSNTANGYLALYRNTTGYSNTANGYYALLRNTAGHYNTANGISALRSNTTGHYNTANGYYALGLNTTGHSNTANGYYALLRNTTGRYNTAVGSNAGPASGYSNLSNTTAIGNGAQVTLSNHVRIGNSSVTSIGGYRAWTNLSDARFKKDIKENVPGLDFILKIKPITFHWDMAKLNEFEGKEYDESSKEKEKIQYTGFIAQEVEAVAEEIGYDFSAVEKPKNEKNQYMLSYAEFTVPLVKAVQQQQAEINTLKSEIELLKQQLIQLTQNTLGGGI
jgi:trimeric autotransporter adhesin